MLSFGRHLTRHTIGRLLGAATVAGVVAFVSAPASAAPPVFIFPPQDSEVEANDPSGHVGPMYSIAYSDPDGDFVNVICQPDSSANFPFGPTEVVCTLHSNDGSAEHRWTITVVDTTPPDILTSNATIEATGPLTIVNYTPPSATDVVGVAGVPACTPAPGFTAALGAHTVTCTVSDVKGNSTTESFTITVRDTTPPTIAQVPASRTVEATSPAGAVITYNLPTAADLVDGTRTVSCAPSSGSTFALGTTAVTCTSRDLTGNVGTASFNATVVDTTAPELTDPVDLTVEATSADGAVVTYTAPTVSDVADATPDVSCVPASGGTFTLGTTTVTCTASDAAGNLANTSFGVTVVDTTPPDLTGPADQTLEATGPDGAAIVYGATAIDLVDETVDVVCKPPSGATFPVGATPGSCTATDDAGNEATAAFTMTVTDTTPPVLSLPGDTFASATSAAGAGVPFDATASDLVDGVVAVECDPASGSTFPLGDTDVTCTAADEAGNTSSGKFTVTVGDDGAPLLNMPNSLTVEATGPDGAAVVFEATATDNVDPNPSVACTPSSGDLFPLGTTNVTCIATDSGGLTTSGAFTVTVSDTTGPSLVLPTAITVDATGPEGVVVDYDASAHDAVAGDVPIECTPPSGSLFPVGTTTVTCTASDAASETARPFGFMRPAQVDPGTGNLSTGTFTVTVNAVIPPSSTTTVPPSVPTTGPSTDSTTTSQPPAPTTDPTAGPTTTGPVAPTTASQASGGPLPETGTDAGMLTAAAAIGLLAGCALLCVVRIRAPKS
jgi:large repetitive protein